MNFNLTGVIAKLNSFNIRAEAHGDEKVPAGDLSLTIQAANTILDVFAPELREAMYEGHAGGQQDIDGVEQTLTSVRFPTIGPLKFVDELSGYTLTIDHGLGGERSNMVLHQCKVNKFSAELEEGGTVELTFRVQISDPSADVVGKLGVQVQRHVVIDLEAPLVAEQPDDEDLDPEAPDDDGPLFPPGEPEAAPLTAGDIFAATEPPAVPVTTRKRRGIGTDAEQAARQAAILAEHDAAGAAH